MTIPLLTKLLICSSFLFFQPKVIKVIPMVSTMFVTYEWTKDMLNIRHDRT